MASLRDLQAAFRRSILDGEDATVAPLVLDAGIAPAQRLQIYRNNTFISLREALETAFPVVRRLVGDDFFRGAARAFVRAHPPAVPCLSEYGAGFAGFLAGFPPASTLAYLPDVARLEWALNEAHCAADAAPLDPQAIAAVPDADRASLRFTLHPAGRLVESRFPIDRIWAANQPEGDAGQVIDLASGGCSLLIGRDERDAGFQRITPAEFVFVDHLARGRTLVEAYEQAAARAPDFAPAGILHRLLSGGFLAGIDAPTPSSGR